MIYPYDQLGVYAIHIAGQLDTSWSDRLGGLTITPALAKVLLAAELIDEANIEAVAAMLADM